MPHKTFLLHRLHLLFILINDQNLVFLLCMCREQCIGRSWEGDGVYFCPPVSWSPRGLLGSHGRARAVRGLPSLRCCQYFCPGLSLACYQNVSFLFLCSPSLPHIFTFPWAAESSSRDVTLSWRSWPQHVWVPQTQAAPHWSLPHTFEQNKSKWR